LLTVTVAVVVINKDNGAVGVMFLVVVLLAIVLLTMIM
jgi:hypothetical protein